MILPIPIPTIDLDFVLAVSFAIGAIIVMSVLATRAWVLRSGFVAEPVAQAERTELMEAIKDAATEQRMRITLYGFWKGRGWKRREKYFFLRPLIERKILHLPDTHDKFANFVSRALYYGLSQPPGAVVLNSRDWTRMASGEKPSIIVGSISNITDSNVQIGHGNVSNQAIAQGKIVELIDALRKDAEGAGSDLRDRANQTADALEQESRAGRWSNVNKWVKRAQDLARSADGIMETTDKVLDRLM